MRSLLIFLLLLAASATASSAELWNLFLIDGHGGRHLQTYTDPQHAGKPIYFPSEDECISLGIAFMTAGSSNYVGFYCKQSEL